MEFVKLTASSQGRDLAAEPWMSVYPVTEPQWAAVLGRPVTDRLRRPIDGVSWEDVRVWLAVARERGLHLRLPLESEWESACVGSANSAFPWGDSAQESHRFAWTVEQCGRTLTTTDGDKAFAGPTVLPESGLKAANTLGLHDMSGLVAEWCVDPSRRQGGVMPVRGGSAHDPVDHLKWPARSLLPVGARFADIGFRCVLDPECASLPSTDSTRAAMLETRPRRQDTIWVHRRDGTIQTFVYMTYGDRASAKAIPQDGQCGRSRRQTSGRDRSI